MADRYWVGGTASWDGTVGTKWSDTSGGAGGFSIPTTADDVFFTALSTGTCTIANGNTGAKSINCTGFTGGIAGIAAISVAGSITLVAGQTYTHTGIVTFTGTGTLITAGKTFSPLTVDGAGITVTLGDALNLSSRDLIITRGTFNTANFNVTANNISSSNSNTRTITLGSSTLTLTGNPPIEFSTSTNLTFNSNTSQINLTPATAQLRGGGQTFYNVSFTSTGVGTRLITGANTFNNLSLTASASGLSQLSISGNQTVNGTFTCAGSSAIARGFVRSDTIGTTRTITANAISADDCDFRDITLAGTASGASPTRAGDCGNNSGITFPAAKTVYWNLAGTQDLNATAWATTSNGSPAINNFPLAQDIATFTNDGSAGTVNFNPIYNIGSLDCSTRTTSVSLNFNNQTNFYGSFTLGSGVSVVTGVATQTFCGRGTQTFTSAAKTIIFSFDINKPAGAFELGDALNVSRSISLTRGTFDAKNYNFTCTTFDSNNANTRTITMGSGLWTLSGPGIVWNTSTTTGLTFNKDSANILLSDTSTSARTFASGALTYNKLTIGGATGTSILTINAGTTFSELASTKTVAHTISFNANQTIGTWSVTGTAFPVSGFQNILSNSSYNTAAFDVSGYRMNYLVAPDSSISGTTPAYVADNGGLTTSKIILVFRPDTTPSSVTVNSLNNYADAGVLTNPANQTITSGSGTAPLVALALYQQTDAGSITTRSFSPAADGEVNNGTINYIKYKIYNSAPSDITVGMTSTTGTARGLASYYLQFNGTSSVTFVGSSITGVVPTVQAGDIVVSYALVSDANSNAPILVPVSPTNGVGVVSSAAGIARTVTITNKTTGIDYLSFQDINSSNRRPVTFWAGVNSINSGGNRGIAFADGTTTQAYVLDTVGAGSFTTPGDWNNANNFIYLIGGGGGGAGSVNSTDSPANSRAGGAGGGGGGFTLLTNQTISGAIAYTIGSAGNSGSGSSGTGNRTSTGGTGGTTIWNTTNTATGGVGGTASSVTPSSTGGAGGTGTYTGGTGGIGGVIVSATRVSGGGGGGAAGVNGNGANGGNGNGSAAISAGDESAGGGGGNGGGTAGGNGVVGTSGVGGNNSLGAGGGASVNDNIGNSGVRGGGGSGAEGTSFRGGLGGNGADILGGFGSGGGSGGSTNVNNSSAGVPGIYGGGGGGAGSTATVYNGAAGAQGAIIIVYSFGSAPVSNSNFFFLFG